MEETLQARVESLLFRVELPNDEINGRLFSFVSVFYDLPYTTNEKPELAPMHRRIAGRIGDLMDVQFLQFLREVGDSRKVDKVIDVLPLRGAVALVPDENRMGGLNTNGDEKYTVLPIGVKRNGPDAKVYFPDGDDEEALKEQLAGVTEDTVIRIKDFGIATGGTSIELIEKIKQLTGAGIKNEQILVQGAAGTLTALERIKAAFPGVNVMFAVEGEMPIERQVKSLLTREDSQEDFLTVLSGYEKVLKEAGTIDHQSYYLNRIRQSNGDGFKDKAPFAVEAINSKDWGDVFFTDMSQEGFIDEFICILEVALLNNGQILTEEDQNKLKDYYMRTLADRYNYSGA